jgi:hypothetical protein
MPLKGSGLAEQGVRPDVWPRPAMRQLRTIMAKQKLRPERALSPHHSDADLLRIALDRIDVLERLVAEMALKSGPGWRKYQGESLTQEAQYILDRARTLNS